MKKCYQIKFVKLLLSLIIILFVMYMIFTDLTFRADEGFTMVLIKRSFINIIKLDSFDVHPPLYYILLKIFLTVFTFYTKSIFIKIIFARLFSFSTFLISFFVLNKIIRNCGYNNNSIISFFSLLLIPGVLFFSTQIRMYSLAGMFLILEFYELDKYNHSNRNLYIILGTIYAIFASFSHYFTAVSAGLTLIVFLIRNRNNRNKFLKIIISGVVLLLSYIPWMLYSLKNVLSNNSSLLSGKLSFKVIIFSFIKEFLNDFTQIEYSALEYTNLTNFFLSLIILCIFICLTIIAFIKMNKKFNNSLINVLTVYFGTIIIEFCSHMLGFESNSAFLYPIFIIYSYFIINILCYIVKINNIVFYKIFIKIFSVIYIVSFILYVHYGCLNLQDSMNIKYSFNRIIRSHKKNIFIRNRDNCNNESSQQLLQRTHMFYVSNRGTYLFYIHKNLITNKFILTRDCPVTNGKLIGHMVWPNIKIK